MPDLDRFYREASAKAAILAVAPASNEGGMRELMDVGGYTFPMLLDPGEIGSAYKIRYVPTLFAIDADGGLVERIIGATDFARLNQIADALAGR